MIMIIRVKERENYLEKVCLIPEQNILIYFIQEDIRISLKR